MRFSDYITNPALFVFPIIGLIAFVSVFLVVTWRTFRTPKSLHDHHAGIPLDAPEKAPQSESTTSHAGEES